MRRRRFVIGLGATGVFVLFGKHGARASAAASRPIRVHLFSGYTLRSAVIGGVRVDVSSAPTVVSPQSGPIDVVATTSDGSVIERHYSGKILSAAVDGDLTIYNDVDIESYVAS